MVIADVHDELYWRRQPRQEKSQNQVLLRLHFHLPTIISICNQSAPVNRASVQDFEKETTTGQSRVTI